jgi:uncharacterized protein
MNQPALLGTAVITGASSGIGAVYADRLARRGYDLLLIARNRDRLEALARRIASETDRTVHIQPADLGTASGMRAVEALLRTDPRITMLVNNAGMGATSPLADSDPDKMEAMIALNVTSLTRLTEAVVPQFLARGTGTIVNIASIVAVNPSLLNGVYGASKAYVLALSLSLHHELNAKGVRVQVVLPGAINTEFWDVAGFPVVNLPQGMVMSAEDLVDAALAGLDQGELVTVPSLPDTSNWAAFDAARVAMFPNLSLVKPASRYRVN